MPKLFEIDLNELIFLGLAVGGAIGVGLAVHWATFAVLGRMARLTEVALFGDLVARTRRPAALFFPLMLALAILPVLDLAGESAQVALSALTICMAGCIGWLSLGVVNALFDSAAKRYSIDHDDNLAAREMQTRLTVFRRITFFVVVVVTLAAMMMMIPAIRHLGISLFASAGAAGLIVGLAARPTLSNLIAGIQIALSQPIRVDDVVIVEGEWGRIEEITTTFVVVKIWDERRLVLPLSYFIEKPFQNWTRKTADLLGTVFLYVDYSVPVDEIRAELDRLVKKSDLWDGKVSLVQVTGTTERTVEIRALVSARNSGDAWDLRCLVREKLVAFVRTNYPAALPRLRAELDRPQGGAEKDAA